MKIENDIMQQNLKINQKCRKNLILLVEKSQLIKTDNRQKIGQK